MPTIALTSGNFESAVADNPVVLNPGDSDDHGVPRRSTCPQCGKTG